MRRDRSDFGGRNGVAESVWCPQVCEAMETVVGGGGHTRIRPDGQGTHRVVIMGILGSMPGDWGWGRRSIERAEAGSVQHEMDQTDRR